MNIEQADAHDLMVRWLAIMTEGTERLMHLQAQIIGTAVAGRIGDVDTPATVGEAISAMWRLPLLYGALCEQATETARQTFHVVSGVQNELVDLACDSLTRHVPALAQSLATGNALFADRRHRSVVISFPDRRTLRAMRAQGGSRGGA